MVTILRAGAARKRRPKLIAYPIQYLTKDEAVQVAEQAYQHDGKLSWATLITDLSQAPEVRGRDLPVWQIRFDDTLQTAIYVASDSGEIVAVRSHLWRVFDFLWMLHILDYDERDDFNNPLVILMASLGLLMVLSGIIMLANLYKKGGASMWLK